MLQAETILDRARAWWRKRQDIRADLDEIRALGATEVAELAAECGISSSQLIELVRAGRHAADEMEEMMRALNIDPIAVKDREPVLFADLQVVCAQCEHKGHCRNDLASHEAPGHYHHYCNNADTLDELRATPQMILVQ